jgi:hypothetical protein
VAVGGRPPPPEDREPEHPLVDPVSRGAGAADRVVLAGEGVPGAEIGQATHDRLDAVLVDSAE